MEILPNQLEFDTYRAEIYLKLSKEVAELNLRINELSASKGQNRDIIITTYRKMVERKEAFMKSWSLDEVDF